MLISPLKNPLKPPRIEGYHYGLLSDRNITLGNSLQLIETEAKPISFLSILGETTATPADPEQPVSPDNPQVFTSQTSFDYLLRGKNLFNIGGTLLARETYTQNCTVSNGRITLTGTVSSNIAGIAVRIKPGTTYTIKRTGTAPNYAVSAYTYENAPSYSYQASTKIRTIAESASNIITFTAGATENYVVVGLGTTSMTVGQYIENIQLEVGSSATTFEAYQGITASITLKDTANNQLENRGIPATYNTDGSVATYSVQDKVVKVDGVWDLSGDTEKMVLDGTNTVWVYNEPNSSETYAYFYSASLDAIVPATVGTKIGLCSDFRIEQQSTVAASTLTYECMSLSGGTYRLRIRILKSRLSTFDNAGLNAYFAAHPATIIFQKNPTPIELCAADQTALASVEKTFAGITNISLSTPIGKVQVEQWSKAATR